MAEQKPRNLEQIKTAACSLFANSRNLTIWDALALVLDELTDAELSAIYRRSGIDWCLAAVVQGTLVRSGIENLGSELRATNSVLRRQDNFRSYGGPVRPRDGKLRRRRPSRRR